MSLGGGGSYEYGHLYKKRGVQTPLANLFLNQTNGVRFSLRNSKTKSSDKFSPPSSCKIVTSYITHSSLTQIISVPLVNNTGPSENRIHSMLIKPTNSSSKIFNVLNYDINLNRLQTARAVLGAIQRFYVVNQTSNNVLNTAYDTKWWENSLKIAFSDQKYI